jgi:hypothetical protein
MKKSPYIPISQYLQSTDVNNKSIPSKDRFKFFIDWQNSFFVYKSLAYFLSSNAQKCISRNSSQFQISNIQFDPKFVINSLVGLLSGFSLLIDKSNFSIFQKVFESLGNQDFQLYFGKVPPEIPTKFFLSIHSLKGIPKYNPEQNLIQKNLLSKFSIPIGLVHLFWKNPINFQDHIFKKYQQTQINDFVIVLNKIKNGIYDQITHKQKTFFQLLSIHQNLLNDLSPINLPSPRPNISSPQQQNIASYSREITLSSPYFKEMIPFHILDYLARTVLIYHLLIFFHLLMKIFLLLNIILILFLHNLNKKILQVILIFSN